MGPSRTTWTLCNNALSRFELEFQGQREKIPESLGRQNRSVEQSCATLGMALKDLQSGIEGISDGVVAKVGDRLTYLCDVLHAMDGRTSEL